MKAQIAMAEQEYKQQSTMSLTEQAKVISAKRELSMLNHEASAQKRSLARTKDKMKALDNQELQMTARNAALEQEIDSESLQKRRAVDALHGEKKLEALYLEEKQGKKRVSQELKYQDMQDKELRRKLADAEVQKDQQAGQP